MINQALQLPQIEPFLLEDPHPENLRRVLGYLLAPIEDALQEVKKTYRECLISSESSPHAEEVFLNPNQTPGSSSRFSHELASEIARYMQKLEGKWLRPALVLLTTDLFNTPPQRGVLIAAGLEMLHNATLIHDDIIDESDIRRGRSSIWKRWGSSATVLMGDLLYAKSMELTTSHGDLRLQQIIAQATARMCQGELHQLQWAGNLKVTEAEYLQVVHDKTAVLLSACTQCGARISGANPEAEHHLRRFGLYLGMAFQITDDVLDFVAVPEELGKAVGNDVAHGKVTLPLIHYLANSPNPEPVIALITGKNGKEPLDLPQLMQSTGSIDYAREIAQRYSQQAREELDSLQQWGVATEKLDHLKRLADFVVSRRF